MGAAMDATGTGGLFNQVPPLLSPEPVPPWLRPTLRGLSRCAPTLYPGASRHALRGFHET